MALNLINVAGVTRLTLFSGRIAETGTTFYTAAADETVKLGQLSVTNTTDNPCVLFLYRVPAGQTPGPTNSLIYGWSIEPRDMLLFDFALFLEPGERVYGEAGRNDALTIAWAGEVYR